MACPCCRSLPSSHPLLLLLLLVCSENVLAAWAFFLVLTWVHVWANMRALRCLVLSSLNQPRLKLLLQHYVAQVGCCCVPDSHCHQLLLGVRHNSQASGRVVQPSDKALVCVLVRVGRQSFLSRTIVAMRCINLETPGHIWYYTLMRITV